MSTESSRSELYLIASETRRAIESLSKARHPVVVRIERTIQRGRARAPAVFPSNWCDYACRALACQIARAMDDPNVLLCSWLGAEGELAPHSWLRFSGFDIDITASQFGDDCDEVIVAHGSACHARRFPDPTACPFFSRDRKRPYFEMLVNRLDAEVDQMLSKERAIRKVSRLCSDASGRSC